MTTLAVPAATWDALEDWQREAVSTAVDLPRLGEPAVYVDDLGADQYVWDDHRITETQVVQVATLLADPTLIGVPDASI